MHLPAPKATFSLRDARDEDYAAMVALRNRCLPAYPETVEQWRETECAIAGRYFSQRVVAEATDAAERHKEEAGEGGAVVAYGHVEAFRESRVGRFVIEIMVAPEHRRRGVGAALYDRLLAIARDVQARSLLAVTWEDQPEAIRFLDRRGFQLAQRGEVSSLDPRRFDDALAERALSRLAAGGITIRSLADVQAGEPDWRRRLYDLCIAVERDMPAIDPYEPPPFDVWRRYYDSPRQFDPAGWFIATDGPRWIGVTGLALRPADPATLGTAITGVLASHRRRGVATALKARAIRWARRRGYHRIDTDNEEHNPMYQLNRRLGFLPRPAELAYIRDLP